MLGEEIRTVLGDNLGLLREHPSDSVDLIYMDPPFNSTRDYRVIDEDTQKAKLAYRDNWPWDLKAEESYLRLISWSNPIDSSLKLLFQSLFSATGGRGSSRIAYLLMMLSRLMECHRCLRQTGSLWIHCDPTESHYLKIIIDYIFGTSAFKGEAIWRRTTSHNNAKRLGPVDDRLLFFTKGKTYTWNPAFHEKKDQEEGYEDPDGRRWKPCPLTGAGTRSGESGQPWRGLDPCQVGKGRHWADSTAYREDYQALTGQAADGSLLSRFDKYLAAGLIFFTKEGVPYFKKSVDSSPRGARLQTIWDDIPLPSEEESWDFDTQKPLALLKRIIGVSSNKGDLVLDPFLGSGTTAVAAYELNRRFIGFERSQASMDIANHRIAQECGVDAYHGPVPGKVDVTQTKAWQRREAEKTMAKFLGEDEE